MGDRGSEYRAVAKDELEALEMTVSEEIQQDTSEKLRNNLENKIQTKECVCVYQGNGEGREQSCGVEEDNDFVEWMHSHCWIHHRQWNLCFTKWCSPGE